MTFKPHRHRKTHRPVDVVHVLGLELQRALKIDERGVVLLQLVATDAAIVMRGGERRIERDAARVAAQRVVDLIGEIHVGVAQAAPAAQQRRVRQRRRTLLPLRKTNQ